eukprot:496630_1
MFLQKLSSQLTLVQKMMLSSTNALLTNQLEEATFQLKYQTLEQQYVNLQLEYNQYKKHTQQIIKQYEQNNGSHELKQLHEQNEDNLTLIQVLRTQNQRFHKLVEFNKSEMKTLNQKLIDVKIEHDNTEVLLLKEIHSLRDELSKLSAFKHYNIENILALSTPLDGVAYGDRVDNQNYQMCASNFSDSEFKFPDAKQTVNNFQNDIEYFHHDADEINEMETLFDKCVIVLENNDILDTYKWLGFEFKLTKRDCSVKWKY